MVFGSHRASKAAQKLSEAAQVIAGDSALQLKQLSEQAKLAAKAFGAIEAVNFSANAFIAFRALNLAGHISDSLDDVAQSHRVDTLSNNIVGVFNTPAYRADERDVIVFVDSDFMCDTLRGKLILTFKEALRDGSLQVYSFQELTEVKGRIQYLCGSRGKPVLVYFITCPSITFEELHLPDFPLSRVYSEPPIKWIIKCVAYSAFSEPKMQIKRLSVEQNVLYSTHNIMIGEKENTPQQVGFASAAAVTAAQYGCYACFGDGLVYTISSALCGPIGAISWTLSSATFVLVGGFFAIGYAGRKFFGCCKRKLN